MVRKSIEERLSQLEAQKKTLQARLGKQERAEETRRKILLGTLIMEHLDRGEDEFAKGLLGWLRRALPEFLNRDSDRKLFTAVLDPRIAPSLESQETRLP
ncbi:mobilization protein [Rhizobium sp. BK060]|uniref:mobilization protein n=1 Tax=Rhizobium sp. BK060 TaxID=2587096 RepID=UPI00161D06CF|nr:mobilization protein [Rhizobium sp. BK060]MBB3396379.1 hypothetical protein [Rhizobium sp. BK060]